MPELFPALRVNIDANRDQKGRFLISGSSSPELLKNISESLAGRVAIVELGTLTWDEALEKPASKFIDSLADESALLDLPKQYDYQKLLGLCLYGTYPEPFLNRDQEIFYDNWVESYSQTYIEKDVRALFPTLNFDAFQRFVSMLAFSSGNVINYSKFASSLDVSQPTVKKYFEIVEGTFLWRKLNSYHQNSSKTVTKASKGHLRDNALINKVLKISSKDQLIAHPNFGQIWEGFVAEQIIKTLQEKYTNIDFYYYRTRSQAEVDLIIETKDGLIPIEIKSGSYTKASQLKALNNFIEEYSCPYGLVINNADEAMKLKEKIIQLPTACL